MKKFFLMCVMIFVSIILFGCNTVQGVGKDIQSVGSLGNDNSSSVTTVKTTEVVYPQQ
jgi:predicted small secreted protein